MSDVYVLLQSIYLDIIKGHITTSFRAKFFRKKKNNSHFTFTNNVNLTFSQTDWQKGRSVLLWNDCSSVIRQAGSSSD